MTQRATGAVLGESAEALYATLQRVGGADMSPRGIRADDQEDGFINFRAPDIHPLHFSPDGQLALTTDPFTKPHLLAAVYQVGGAEPAEQICIWPLLNRSRAACWLNDSRRLLTIDNSAAVVLWQIRDEERGATEPPRGSDLCSIAKPDEALQLVWLSRVADSNMLRGVAVYRTAEETEERHLSVSLFTISPDADQPLAEIARLPLPPLPNSSDDHWAISPSLEWLYLREQQVRLAHLDFDEGSMTLAELAPFDGWADVSFTPDERWMVYRTGSGTVARCDLTSGSAEVAASSSVTLIDSDQAISKFAHSADGSLFAYCDDTTFRLSIMEAGDPSTAVSIRDDSETWAKLRFSDDGKWLAGWNFGEILLPLAVGKIER